LRQVREIGLFPLPIVLLPGERLPLHIFEPRYRELIGECAEARQPFGLVLEDEQGLRETGTTAFVADIIERLPDGRLNVIVEGAERFRILEETRGRSFRTALVEPAPDAGDTPRAGERDACLAAFRALAAEAGAEVGRIEPEPQGLCYFLAARVGLDPQLRQELLEERSERARTLRLTEILTRARAALRWERVAHERAATNGRVQGAEVDR
jgi:ATP-dependent Lon protease